MKAFQSLEIYPGELKKVTLCLLYAFAIGICQGIVIVIPLSIFLQIHPASELPYVYVGTSLATLVLGVLYGYFERKLSFFVLFTSLLLVMLTPLAVLNIFIIYSKSFWTSAFLILWSQLIWRLTDLEFWGLMNRVLSIMEAKRLFGLIGAVSSLSIVFAGLSIPLITQFIASEYLLLTASVALLGCLALLFAFNRSFPKEMKGSEENESTDTIHEDRPKQSIYLLNILNSPYIYKLILAGFLTNAAYYSMDLAFNSATQEYFVTEEKITNFLGIFFGVANAIELIGRLFLLPYILEKFGTISAALLLPVLTIGLIGMAIASQAIYIPIVFLFISMSKMFDEAIRFSILEPAKLLMYQLLTPPMRLWIQAKIETVIDPLASIVVSGLFIVMSYYVGAFYEISILAVTLVLALLSIVNYISIKKDYLLTLAEALGMRYFAPRARLPIDKAAIRLFQEYLSSPYPGAVIYSLETLEQADRELFMKMLQQSIVHPHLLVKKYILGKVSKYRLKGISAQVLTLIRDSSQPQEIRKEAIQALAAVADSSDELKLLKESLSSSILEIRRQAILGILKYEIKPLLEEARQVLILLANSSKTQERLQVLKIYEEMPQLADHALVRNSINDPDSQVRQAVISVIARASLSQYYSFILASIGDVVLNEASWKACIELTDKIELPFKEQFSSSSDVRKISLLELLKQIPFSHDVQLLMKAFLVEQLSHNSMQVNHAIWQILSKWGFDFVKDPSKIELINQEIEASSECLSHLAQVYSRFSLTSELSFLLGSLKNQIHACEQFLLLLLSFQYPREMMSKIKERLALDDKEQQGYALELLQVLLEKKHASRVLPLLTECHLLHVKGRSKDLSQKETSSALVHIAENRHHYFSEITCAAALYSQVKLYSNAENNFLNALVKENKPLIVETCQWALNKMQTV